jgi:hypothetical protein
MTFAWDVDFRRGERRRMRRRRSLLLLRTMESARDGMGVTTNICGYRPPSSGRGSRAHR